MNLAQLVQSHALSFFHLSSPDLLLGMDADPAKRNIVGVIEARPSLGRDGISLRKWGQQIIAMLAGKRIHPAWVVPGGVSEPLSREMRDKILDSIPEALAISQRTLSWFKGIVEEFREEIRTFGNFPSMFMALVNPQEQAHTTRFSSTMTADCALLMPLGTSFWIISTPPVMRITSQSRLNRTAT